MKHAGKSVGGSHDTGPPPKVAGANPAPRSNSAPPRFTALDCFGDFSVRDGGNHFMTTATLEGAQRFAAFLNLAVGLCADWRLLALDERLARSKIVGAVDRIADHPKMFGASAVKTERDQR